LKLLLAYGMMLGKNNGWSPMNTLYSLLLFLITCSPLMADDGSAPPMEPNKGEMTQGLVMLGITVGFFYFILIRPEQKRRKEMEEQREGLKKGDKVTAMGIIGTVSQINEEKGTVILKMVDGNKIEFELAAISHVDARMEKTVPLKQ
jgi:preprotein translocase subunit YajC